MRRRMSGFTLIELMVVIVLIGILASVAHISLGDNNARNARLEADVLASLMHGLREKAVLDSQEYGLRLEPDGYQVMRFERDRWQLLDNRVRLPLGLKLALTLEGHAQPLTPLAEVPHLLWLSNDENTPFSLHFESSARRWLSIISDGLAEPVIVTPETHDED